MKPAPASPFKVVQAQVILGALEVLFDVPARAAQFQATRLGRRTMKVSEVVVIGARGHPPANRPPARLFPVRLRLGAGDAPGRPRTKPSGYAAFARWPPSTNTTSTVEVGSGRRSPPRCGRAGRRGRAHSGCASVPGPPAPSRPCAWARPEGRIPSPVGVRPRGSPRYPHRRSPPARARGTPRRREPAGSVPAPTPAWYETRPPPVLPPPLAATRLRSNSGAGTVEPRWGPLPSPRSPPVRRSLGSWPTFPPPRSTDG